MTNRAVTALVLAGGEGTRLRPTFALGPKVLAPVNGRPFITHLLDRLEAAGITRVILCTGYMAQSVRHAVGERYGGLVLAHSTELEPLDTGGALRRALPLGESDPVLVLNGDSWCDFHLPTMLAVHRAHHAAGTLWLVPVKNAGRFATVRVGVGGAIEAFREKARSGPGWVSAGAYLLSRELLESIAQDCAVSLEREVFPRWVGKGLIGCTAGQSFLDIGTPDAYAEAGPFMTRASQGAVAFAQRRAVLLDRDGTICVERNYLRDPDEVELLPGAAAGMRELQKLGLALVIVTNQSNVSRGYLAVEQLFKIHCRLEELLRAEGVRVDAIHFCPHRPEEGCNCRKPAPEMALRAARELGFDLGASFVVGDKPCDVELGSGLGATTFLVTTGYGATVLARRQATADYAVDNLSEMAEVVGHLLGVRSPHSCKQMQVAGEFV